MRPLTDDKSLIRGLAIAGIVTTQLMNLSSLPSILEIIRSKSTLLYPSFPFSVSIVASTVSIIYSILSDQITVGISSMMTVGQCVIYLIIHLYYSPNRLSIIKEFVCISVIIGASLGIGPLIRCNLPGSSSSECSRFGTEWFGIVMAAVSCVRYGAQSSTFYTVIKTRNSASISPWMTAGALVASAVWCVYSILAGDPYYLASGLAGVFSCVAQIALLLIFPRQLPPNRTKGIDLETSQLPE
jgi:uncharacterized protein with PQ loop repeat